MNLRRDEDERKIQHAITAKSQERSLPKVLAICNKVALICISRNIRIDLMKIYNSPNARNRIKLQ